MFIDRVVRATYERDLDGSETIVAERGHGLQVAGDDACIGLAVGWRNKAARFLHFHC